MVLYSNLDREMEADAISKNGACLKSQKSRRSFKPFALLLTIMLIVFGCEQEKDEPTNGTDTSQTITVSEVNTAAITSTENSNIAISESIRLFVPAGTFAENTEIAYAVADNVPQLNDAELEITEKPVFFSLPISMLEKGMTVTMPLQAGFDRNKTILFVSDGEETFPLYYTIENNSLKIDLDLRAWTKYWTESSNNSYASRSLRSDEGTAIGKFIILLQAQADKNIPINMVGIKNPVNPIITDKIKRITRFDAINSIEANEKVLIFIHGWGGSPESTWWDFLYAIKQSGGFNNYSKILTFGYNSALHIKTNGELLAQELKKINKGNKNIDIVAHSMGGLVARVAIEKNGCDKYVRKFITLGTPHKGSPLGAYRNWILADKENNLYPKQEYTLNITPVGAGTDLLPEFETAFEKQKILNYKLNTEGFEDLDSNSDFIKNYINPSVLFSDIAYTTVGAKFTNDILENLLNLITGVITSPHDGVVELSSALGLKNGSNVYITEKTFELAYTWEDLYNMPHTQLTENANVIEYIFNVLKEQNDIPTAGLVAYYPFNGNTQDESGNGNHGKIIGNLKLTNGRTGFNNAYEFSGTSWNYISVPNAPSLNNNSFTISVWVNIPKKESGHIVNKGRDITIGTYGLNANSVRATMLYGGVNDALFGNVPLNQWILLTGTVDGNIAKSYLNGQLINTATLSRTFICNTNEPLTIGMHYYNGVPSMYTYPFTGIIDDVRIYNRALTETEVKALYK